MKIVGFFEHRERWIYPPMVMEEIEVYEWDIHPRSGKGRT